MLVLAPVDFTVARDFVIVIAIAEYAKVVLAELGVIYISDGGDRMVRIDRDYPEH